MLSRSHQQNTPVITLVYDHYHEVAQRLVVAVVPMKWHLHYQRVRVD
jgi:hypothetical protein